MSRFALLLGALLISVVPLVASTTRFSVPDDLALRIRLDDTVTSVDSQVSDPFSARVVDQGDYRNARVYGHIAQIDMSGKFRGHTSMMLRFDRLVMPHGRRAPIHAEMWSFITHPQGKEWTWKVLSNQAGAGARASRTQ